MAREACSIVKQIKDEEQRTVWTKEYEDRHATETGDIYPGMMFMHARERMEKTKLWKIVKRMPKGALLHCHFEAMIDTDWLLDELFAYDGLHIEAPASLHDEAALKSVVPELSWKKATASPSSSIWSADYKANEAIPLDAAADSFPNGGRPGFRDWYKSRTSITHEESLLHHDGPNEIWRKFISCFRVLGTALCWETIFKKAVKRMLSMLNEDGVRYVEVRAVFRVPFFVEGSENPETGYDRKMQAMEEAIDEFMATEEGKDFWGARLIWTDIRHLETKLIIENMKECIAMKQAHPELIAGYDLVGQEDLGRPLVDFLPELFWFKKACAEAGVNIPFFFHAGETLGDGDSVDQNLFDAILLGTRRIGHGFSSRGVPVALCNDDPSILGHVVSGMTHDFWQALQGWDNLGLAGLASLAENSVRWSALDDISPADWQKELKDGAYGKTEKAELMQEWSRSWESFCGWIVKKYGPQYGGNGVL